MASKRMFSLEIVDSDAFLEMPASSQLLYFHLSMRADDDGFVDNPKKIMKITGVAEDDIKILLAKRFILSFESGIIVIKHWRIHNYIAKDRYKETKYIEEKSKILLKDNGSYTECIQNVDADKIRLGKIRLGKIRLDNTSEAQAPTQYNKKKYPKEDYREVIDCYCSVKGLSPMGDEYSILQREIKLMFVNGRSASEICSAIQYIKKANFTWTLKTVRLKMPEIMAKIGVK